MKHVSLLLCASSLALAAVTAQAASPASSETLPSGVIVQTLTKGTGPSPKASDTVKVHYRGTLTDGKEFDSSYKRGQPISFPLNRVIPCWTEGVQKMQVGGKAKLTCPAATAYGANGVPGTIPPNATLNFEVELLGIGS
jgi:FKBP-type peptidyl-prolyl cis-trans isomerase FkpA